MKVKVYDNPFRIFIGEDDKKHDGTWLSVTKVADKFLLKLIMERELSMNSTISGKLSTP